MKRVAPLLLLLAGCPGAGSVLEEVPPELGRTSAVVPPLSDRHPFADPSAVDIGRWARYREKDRSFTLAVVGREADGTWLELVEDGGASARLVAPDGAVLRAFFQEPGGAPREQAPRQMAEAVAPKRHETSREESDEKVKVGARELTAKAVRLRLEDLEGRLTRETWIWHPDVPPLYAGSPLGGLVRRESAEGLVELLDFGADAKPQVRRP